MSPEQSLREMLRKIEALFAGAATDREKVAASTAAKLSIIYGSKLRPFIGGILFYRKNH